MTHGIFFCHDVTIQTQSGLMRKVIVLSILLTAATQIHAQDRCSSNTYQQSVIQQDPDVSAHIKAAETFVQQRLTDATAAKGNGGLQGTIFKIPVVVHVLYHTQAEKISDELVASQIAALNKYFRRKNADTSSTPAYFRAIAADCEIEFQLAYSDPKRRSTSGITRKYTPVTKWTADDKMKFSSEMGEDAWDTKSYLNIWVCNLDKFAGYASMPGGDEKKDGLVISYAAFGTGTTTGYNLGKTAVHEIGHWLSLKHLWGDEYCGDDGVNDTPKQASYTSGCPSVVRITCGNGPYGDMYMNFMDFTNDACLNMFTQGQKARMRALFEPGGPRSTILASKGLDIPLIFLSPLPEEDPKWLKPNLYPNPASSGMTLDLAYDIRWIGKTIFVMNLQGQNVMNVTITSKTQHIDISRLQSGVYFLAAKKDDGESMKLKFLKL
jgi:Pregnancy-associated plasma protein-A/Secretion system C-terminal sorting domain